MPRLHPLLFLTALFIAVAPHLRSAEPAATPALGQAKTDGPTPITASDFLKIKLVDKAAMDRSGAVAQGLSAINTYIGSEQDPADYARMVSNDLMGITRDDLAYDLGRHVDESVHLFEEWGLPIWKTDDDGVRHDGAESQKEGLLALKDGGKPVRSGKWQIMINGESYKWIVAEAAKKALGLDRIQERVFIVKLVNDKNDPSRIAGAVGFSTLLIADKLAGDGDTFTVLQAVLDTQFWLATHVTCITFGYATTFLAGGLGMLYILGGVLTPTLNAKMEKELGRMIYGVVCFAIFFSFVGTVLGGLWADDSWGRFWGWDPKENGALIIVLWNALVLHAYWDKMVRNRGLAVLAVLGNIAVAWSWFGVNQLSVGLHSYGFTEGIALALVAFVASQLAVVGLAMVPRRLWLSTHAAT